MNALDLKFDIYYVVLKNTGRFNKNNIVRRVEGRYDNEDSVKFERIKDKATGYLMFDDVKESNETKINTKLFDYEAFKNGAIAVTDFDAGTELHFVDELTEDSFICKWIGSDGVWRAIDIKIKHAKHWRMKPIKTTWHFASWTADDGIVNCTGVRRSKEALVGMVESLEQFGTIVQYHTFEREE